MLVQQVGWLPKELAMFLAQIIWESGGLRYNQEIDCISGGCPGHYETSNDHPGVIIIKLLV